MTYLIYHLVKYVDCMTDLLIALPGIANKRHTSEVRVSLLANQYITTPFTADMIFPRIILPASLVNKKARYMVIPSMIAAAAQCIAILDRCVPIAIPTGT